MLTSEGAYGNTVSTGPAATASISLALSLEDPPATLGLPSSPTRRSSDLTFSNLTVHKVGTAYKLTASSGTLTPADSSLFNITHGAATQLKFTMSRGQV